MRNFFIVAALLGVAAGPLWGQAVSTQILGRVTDPSGAVIPGAQLTATHLPTGDSRTTQTNETGNYIFPLLNIGAYEVTCEAEGFTTEVRPNIELRLQDKLRLDFAMHIGEHVETIEVTDVPPLLHTDDATLGTVVDRKRLVDLPLNGRNFAQLATLIPGVTYGPTRMGFDGQGTIGTRSLPGQAVGLAANGQRDINQNITLDGVNSVEPHKNAMFFGPSIEAVREFKIQTASYSAEFGGNSGLHADVAIRSGTNELHGSFYEFLRNDRLDARGFFLPEPFQKNKLRRNQFGGIVSGPLSKDKTFWLANYEGRRERRSSPRSLTVPTPAMRQGDFSELLEPGNRWFNRTTPIIPPGADDPLPNNIIPESMINPVARNVLTFKETSPFPEGGFIPFPNFDPEARAFGTTVNLVGTDDEERDSDQYLSRLDHYISETDRLFGRYLLANGTWDFNPVDRVSHFVSDFRTQNTSLGYSKILSPTTVNDFRFGWLRNSAATTGDQTEAGFSQRDLGIDLRVIRDGNRTLTPFEEGLPEITLFGYTTIRSGKIEKTISSVYSIQDTLSWNVGKHNFKLGGTFHWNTVDLGAANSPRGRLGFTRDIVADAFASFLLGYQIGAESAQGFPESDLRQRRAGLYWLDDYKATSRLTINYGVRWDFFGVVDDANGLLRTLSFAPGDVQTFQGSDVPLLIPEPQTTASLYEVPFTQIMPRLGIAYRLSDSWVLRAGGGQYYAPLQTNSFSILSLNPPFSGGVFFLNNPRDPVATIDDPFAGIPMMNLPQSLTMLGSLDATDGNRSHFKGNDVWQWTLELEKSLGSDLVLGMAYVGSAASNLDLSVENFNNPDPGLGNPNARRPILFYADSESPDVFRPVSTIRRLESTVSSNYNALQLRAEKRYSGGVTFNASFTYSKSLGIGYSTNENGGFGPPSPQDPRNFRGDYGRGGLDQKYRFVFSHVWELPWFRSARGWKHAVLGGWAVNGIVTLASGLPVTVFQGGRDSLNIGFTGGVPRPHIAPGATVERVMDGRTLQQWFNTTAFVRSKCDGCPGEGLFVGPKGYGNAGVGLFDSPALKTWDFGLFKEFRITEGQRLQVRWEAFNFLNTPQFGPPIPLFGSPSFGQITRTLIGNREMQFGLRYSF